MLDIGTMILNLLYSVLYFWNKQVELVYEILCESPDAFKGGVPWGIVTAVEPIFVAVGSSLVVLFFVIGFCSESIDIKEEMRFENVLRSLMRIGLAIWFVRSNLSISKAIIKTAGNLLASLGGTTHLQLRISQDAETAIDSLSIGESLIFFVIAIVIAVIIIGCTFFMLYTVYFRFMRLLVIIPFGSLAYATIAGNRMVSHTAVTYFKYFMSVVLEAVTMMLALMVCNAVLSAGLPSFVMPAPDWIQTLFYFLELAFAMLLTVGAMKEAQIQTSKMLGL